MCAVGDYGAIGIPGFRGSNDAIRASRIVVIDERPISRMKGTDRAPIEKLNRACEAVSRAVWVDEHEAMVNADGEHFAEAQTPTKRRPVAVNVEVDVIVRLVPESRVVGEG